QAQAFVPPYSQAGPVCPGIARSIDCKVWPPPFDEDPDRKRGASGGGCCAQRPKCAHPTCAVISPVAPISGVAIASQSAAIVGLMMFGGLISNRASLAHPAPVAVRTCDRF